MGPINWGPPSPPLLASFWLFQGPSQILNHISLFVFLSLFPRPPQNPQKRNRTLSLRRRWWSGGCASGRWLVSLPSLSWQSVSCNSLPCTNHSTTPSRTSSWRTTNQMAVEVKGWGSWVCGITGLHTLRGFAAGRGRWGLRGTSKWATMASSCDILINRS